MTNTAGLAVELTASYAHRVGDAVHLVLALPAASAPVPEIATLQLRKGDRVVPVPASPRSTPTGTLVEATVSTRELGRGTWSLALVEESQRPARLQARLVYSDKQPVALLPGAVPTTTLAPPRPKPAAPTLRTRLYTAAAGVADASLRALPEERAARYRSVLRKAGRRLHG